MPLPKKVLRTGVKDMVRISDARCVPRASVVPLGCIFRIRKMGVAQSSYDCMFVGT